MFTYDDYAVGLSLNEITDIQTSLVVWDEDSIDSDYYTTEPISLLK